MGITSCLGNDLDTVFGCAARRALGHHRPPTTPKRACAAR
jgi:hypothetical protein